MEAPLADFDAITGSEVSVIDPYISDSGGPDPELKKIVDDMVIPPHSASLGSFRTSRLMRQVKPKFASASCCTNPRADVDDPDDEYIHIQLDTCDAVRDDSFTRVGRKGDHTESIPGLLGTGKWRQLKGGITIDSGCSIDTVPTGHAPPVAMSQVPANRANRRIHAANGTRSREHGVKQLKFRTREGRRQDWEMLVAEMKKALKSVATTCDGDG